jgi:4-cresol dehydrogenase (hydroxylating)
VLQPARPAYKPFLIQFDDERAIVDIVETIRPLRIGGVIPNACMISHALYDAPVVAKRADYVTGPGAISDEAVRRIMKNHGLGAWNVVAALYGTQEQVDLHWKMVTDAFGKTGKRAS